MSVAIMSTVWKLKLPSTDKLVLLAIADNSNDEGVCWPRISTLCQKTCLSERAVQLSIARLHDIGLLTIQERPGRSNVYLLTPACGAPPHYVHPASRAPTPAPGAPQPPHVVHPTPARGAPITIMESSSEPSKNLSGPSVDKSGAVDNSAVRERAAEIWGQLLASSGRHPARDSHLQRAIDAVGGWGTIRVCTPQELPALRRSFCEAYAT